MMGAANASAGNSDSTNVDRAAANARGRWTDCPAFGIGAQYSLAMRSTSDAQLSDAYGTKPAKLDYVSSAGVPPNLRKLFPNPCSWMPRLHSRKYTSRLLLMAARFMLMRNSTETDRPTSAFRSASTASESSCRVKNGIVLSSSPVVRSPCTPNSQLQNELLSGDRVLQAFSSAVLGKAMPTCPVTRLHGS
jgi:hypothetical protein